MKKLFTLIAALVCAVCVNAEDYEFSLTDLGSGYGSSYDPATKTITFEGEWKGRGWWLGDVDLSAYTKIVVECEALTLTGQIVIEYDEGNSTGSAKAGSTKIEANLDPAKSQHVKQVYLQSDKAGTITLVKAYATWVDPSIIWEGSANFGTAWDWNATVGLSGGVFANVKSGEYIEFEYTINGETDDHQIKALFGEWGNENHNMIASMKEKADAEYDVINVENGTTSIAFKLTDDDIATLKSGGLRISGKDITLTKVRSTSTPTAITNTLAPAKAENNVRYNLLGVKNGNGVYIMNGKKYLK